MDLASPLAVPLRRPLVPLPDRNVTTVLEGQLADRPDAPAMRDRDRTLSYGDVFEQARLFGGGLARTGVGRSATVLLMLDNHVDFALCWLGAAVGGAVEVPVNTAYRGAMLVHLLNDSGAEVLVAEDRYCDRIADVADQLNVLRTVVVRGGAGAALPPRRFEVIPFEALIDGVPIDPVRTDPWEPVGIMYTSGTTGPSKGVLVTHGHAYNYCSPEVWGACGPADHTLVTLPLFHIGGQWAGVYNALIAGAESIILDRFHATTYWEDVRGYGATYAVLLGTMANFLYRQPERPDDADNPMTRALMVPVIPEVESFSERFGIAVGTAYGSTEGSSSLVSAYGDARPDSCGRPREDFEVKIVDEHDIEVPRGEVGQLVVRSREPWSVMLRYHGRPDATAEAWRNGWLHTGDAFRMNEEGRFVFVDRTVDALRRRGENISSFEVETAINGHPAVLESAVIGVTSEHTEQEILAVVALKPDAAVTPEKLCDHLVEVLPYFMVPRYLRFVGTLPKTPTEKIKKDDLRNDGITDATWDREAARHRVLDGSRWAR